MQDLFIRFKLSLNVLCICKILIQDFVVAFFIWCKVQPPFYKFEKSMHFLLSSVIVFFFSVWKWERHQKKNLYWKMDIPEHWPPLVVEWVGADIFACKMRVPLMSSPAVAKGLESQMLGPSGLALITSTLTSLEHPASSWLCLPGLLTILISSLNVQRPLSKGVFFNSLGWYVWPGCTMIGAS